MRDYIQNMDKSKTWAVGIAIFVVIGGGILAANRAAHNKHVPARVQVTATIYPLAEFARQVGGDRVNVTTLVKPGVEPHDYDPTTREIAGIYKSALFIYNGGGLEPWVPRLSNDLQANNVMLADATYNITLRNAGSGGKTTDPHVWLDPVLAIQQVETVRKGMVAVDPQHAYDYTTRARNYTKRLQALDQEFKAGLAHCQSSQLVTSHQALGYLAARYGLQTLGIAGLSPDDEPSPQKLADITDFVRAHNVHYILFESAVNPKLAQTIASESGAQTISFNPLESLTTAQINVGQDYLSVQRDNLHTLQTALGCTP